MTSIAPASLPAAVSTHLPVTYDTLFDASIFTALTIVFAVLGVLLSAERRRGLVSAAVFACGMLLGLWVFLRFAPALPDAMLYDVLREMLLALLAFSVLRSTLIFGTRVLLARLQIPHIMGDVLLTLGLIAYALYRLNIVGVNLAGIVTTSAVITGAIAFSAQEILGALWAGLALQGEHTLRQGDWIRFNDKIGQVVHLRWRSTAIATCDHETIIIPNAALMKDKIILVGRHGEAPSHLRRHVKFSVSYDAAPGEVLRIIDEALQRAEIGVMARAPAPFSICKGFGDSGIEYEVLYHITDLHHYPQADSAVLSHVYAALKRHGMSIPYPHRVVQVQRDTEARAARRDHQARRSALATMPIFASLTEAESDRLATDLKPAPFVVGTVVCRQGEAADSLFVLASGSLAVFHEDAHGARQKLAELKPPSYFGEMGLLLGRPRAATVVAGTDVLCYRLDRPSFDAILRNRPEIIEDLSRALAQRQSENDATLHALDAETRSRKTRGQAAELVRIIRDFFGVASDTPVKPGSRVPDPHLTH
ncbi:MAG: mechanosensitive ion channel family protein [Pseudomonadota bacterium]|nr:mechanosensitive ion channel family protein [Pseudomonadota bacterium]